MLLHYAHLADPEIAFEKCWFASRKPSFMLECYEEGSACAAGRYVASTTPAAPMMPRSSQCVLGSKTTFLPGQASAEIVQ
jgi:hypothetical protein